MKKVMLKREVLLFLSIVFVLGLAACGGAQTTPSEEPEPSVGGSTGEAGETGGAKDVADTGELTTLEKAQQEGAVRVGFANEQPYAYATPNGEITGEAVEVARVILQNLGIEEMIPVLSEFSQLIPGLQAGRVDIITAGMYITPERAQQVAFANPEYKIGEALAVKSGNPLDLHSYEDIAANPEAKVGVMAGGAEYKMMVAIGVTEDQIVTAQDQPAVVESLRTDRVDAITMTGPSLQAMLEEYRDSTIERVEDFTQPVIDGVEQVNYGAAAFRKEDADFVAAFNAELAKLKASGELFEIISAFGFTEAELPGDVTVEDIVGE